MRTLFVVVPPLRTPKVICVLLKAPLMLVLLCIASSAAAGVAVPKTPAGRVLSAWLDALNSGDRSRVTAYVKRYQADDPHGSDVLVEHVLDVRRETGGFDLMSVERAEPLVIEFVINARSTPQTWFVSLEVRDEKSPRVVELREDGRATARAPSHGRIRRHY